jgi:hypothetical protein
MPTERTASQSTYDPDAARKPDGTALGLKSCPTWAHRSSLYTLGLPSRPSTSHEQYAQRGEEASGQSLR